MLDIFPINPSVVSKSLRSVNTILQVLLLDGQKWPSLADLACS
jgi:hypothetical protein